MKTNLKAALIVYACLFAVSRLMFGTASPGRWLKASVCAFLFVTVTLVRLIFRHDTHVAS